MPATAQFTEFWKYSQVVEFCRNVRGKYGVELTIGLGESAPLSQTGGRHSEGLGLHRLCRRSPYR